MLLLGIFDKVGVNIGLWITTPLFKLAAFAFKIFMILAQSDVLKQIDYKLLLTNFYVILGLIMLFIMAFALLRGIVNPDDQKQGTTVVKNIIINFVISCIILGFLPTIFPFMFDVQDSILRYNVIGGFFGYGDTGHELEISDNVNEVEASAYRLVNGVYTAFFNVSDGYCSNFLATSSETYNSKKEELEACQDSLLTDDELYDDGGVPIADSFLTFKQYVNQTGQFGVYSSFVDQISEGQIDFDFLILLIAGVALLYIGTSYCFDMGLRLIKLIFYQLIAPIPIFLRVIPNSKFSGTFNQWLKVTLTCWMEVFVRIFIFCFATWLCSAIMETDFITNTVYDYGRTTGLFTTAFILMAVIMFMKRSPKLLSEVTGIDSGNMKLGIREKLAEGGGLVAGAAIGAGATTLVRNTVAARENFKGNFADVKGKKGREKAKAIGKGGLKTIGAVFKSAGSMAAGATSGLVSGGKAGWGAKNEKDMVSAAGKGAKSATNARIKRKAYHAAHQGENIIGARVNDRIQDVKAWASGGFEAEEAQLNAYNNLLSAQDKAKSATEKVMSKFSTNTQIVSIPTKFKGINNATFETEFNTLFKGQSLATMENTINSMKNQKMEKRKWMHNGVEYEETDNDFEERIRDHNAKIAAYESMYQQVRKDTIKNVQSMVFGTAIDPTDGKVKSAYEIAGLKDTDVSAIRAELLNAQNMLNAMGRASDINLGEEYKPGLEKGAGYSFDTAASNVEQARNALYAEYERKKAQRDARKGNNS